ncbi:MAG: C-terminal binding protein [Halobacteriaceae archaeon]
MPYKVLVSASDVVDLDVIREELAAVDAEVTVIDAHTEAEVREAVADADALLVDSTTPVTAAVLDDASDLRVVGRCGIGVDNVAVEAAADRDVVVTNVPDYCVDEVTTHALSLALACVRNLSAYDASVRAGEWDWAAGRPLRRLRGRTLGLAAFGKIPRRLSRKIAGFGMTVAAYDPYVDAEEMAEYGVEKVDFETLLAESDVLSVHVPLTEETRGLFDAEAFAAMREDAVFVNTSRGPVVDTDALAAALADGELARAGVDVMPEEPPDASPLFDRDDVILSPHVAWYSEEAREELSRRVAADAAAVLAGKDPRTPVDPQDPFV